MAVNGRFAAFFGFHAILDNDGAVETREMFSTELVRSRLQTIHDVIGVAFKAVATDHAFNVWS